jgi:hypothetical protein
MSSVSRALQSYSNHPAITKIDTCHDKGVHCVCINKSNDRAARAMNLDGKRCQCDSRGERAHAHTNAAIQIYATKIIQMLSKSINQHHHDSG